MSTTYTDANGTQRTVKVTVMTVEKVYEATGVDLCELPQLADITSNVRKFLPICKVIQGLDETDEQFCEAHANGDTIDACVEATLEALEHFFPKALRELIQEQKLRAKDHMELAVEVARVTLGGDSGRLQGLLESTLSPSV